MRRPLIIGSIAAAFLLAAVSPASAGGPGDYNPPQVYKNVSHGTGTATVDGQGDQLGNLSASATATGGTKKFLLRSYSSPTTASTRATVSDGGEITEEGAYQVTVTFANAETEESAAGSGVAQGRAAATAYFGGRGSAGELFPVGTEAVDLSTTPGSVVVQFEVELNGPGQFSIEAEIAALSEARGRGNTASTESSGQVTDISYERVG